jgi:hypothetical protein
MTFNHSRRDDRKVGFIPQALVTYTRTSNYAAVRGLLNDGHVTPYVVANEKWAHRFSGITHLTFPHHSGEKPYLIGCSDDKFWFVQPIKEDGTFGKDTDSGHFDQAWPHMRGYLINGRGFIFAHRESGHWFIREVGADGKLGIETAAGKFGRFYGSLTVLTFKQRSYLFGQSLEGRRWFIQQLLPGGGLGEETSSGSFDSFYPTVCSVSFSDYGYVIAQTNERNNFYFVQRISDDGKLREETEVGNWVNFYPLLTVVKTVDGAYLLGQCANRWFISPVTTAGRIDREIENGQWSEQQDFIASIPSPRLIGTDSWMTALHERIAGLPLKQIIMPGSHDAGMYISRKGQWGGGDGNTRTQSLTIKQQLEAGSRYFDLRPVCTGSGSDRQYDMGHFSQMPTGDLLKKISELDKEEFLNEVAKLEKSLEMDENKNEKEKWIYSNIINIATDYMINFSVFPRRYTGARGGSLSDILNDVASYLENSDRRELVILKFSHCIDLDERKEFSENDWKDLINQITGEISPIHKYIFRYQEATTDNGWAPLAHLTMASYVTTGSKVIALFDLPNKMARLRAPGAGVFHYKDVSSSVTNDDQKNLFHAEGDLQVYDHYSETEDVDYMFSNQLSLLLDTRCHQGGLFLLSWTLTQKFPTSIFTSDIIQLLINSSSPALRKILSIIHIVSTPPTIINMAKTANALLPRLLRNWHHLWVVNGKPRNMMPNVIYLDDIQSSNTAPIIDTFIKTLPQ